MKYQSEIYSPNRVNLSSLENNSDLLDEEIYDKVIYAEDKQIYELKNKLYLMKKL